MNNYNLPDPPEDDEPPVDGDGKPPLGDPPHPPLPPTHP